MSTFICTVCQNRIKEHGSKVDRGYYNDTRPMIEDTTKLYDKSFLCPHFVHVRYHNIDVCKSKRNILVSMMRCVPQGQYLSITQKFYVRINARCVSFGI